MNPVNVTIELDLDKHLRNFVRFDEEGEEVSESTTIEDVILDMAARSLVVGIDKELRRDLGGRVREIRDEIIVDELRPEIENALSQPFRRSNSYGEPTGPETTLREEIVRVAQDMLNKPVRSTARYDQQRTLVEETIHTQVHKVLASELKAAVDEAKAAVRAAVTTEAAVVIEKTISALAAGR
jgi:hypothetical protein